MFSEALIAQASAVLEAARAKGFRVATAESCTGGLIAALLTEIAGSSDVFERGFVTYSNLSKQELLGVPETLLLGHGAVSKDVAGAMAEGALRHSQAMLSVAVTGIAGPGGGSAEKPVGLVYIAAARRDAETTIREFRFGDPDRAAIRRHTVAEALDLLMTFIEKSAS